MLINERETRLQHVALQYYQFRKCKYFVFHITNASPKVIHPQLHSSLFVSIMPHEITMIQKLNSSTFFYPLHFGFVTRIHECCGPRTSVSSACLVQYPSLTPPYPTLGYRIAFSTGNPIRICGPPFPTPPTVPNPQLPYSTTVPSSSTGIPFRIYGLPYAPLLSYPTLNYRTILSYRTLPSYRTCFSTSISHQDMWPTVPSSSTAPSFPTVTFPPTVPHHLLPYLLLHEHSHQDMLPTVSFPGLPYPYSSTIPVSPLPIP